MAYFAASVDDVATNQRFAASLGLDYPLLSDVGKDVARAYGVLTPGISLATRCTFYIGADGRIRHIDRSPSVGSHGADAVRKLAELGVARKP